MAVGTIITIIIQQHCMVTDSNLTGTCKMGIKKKYKIQWLTKLASIFFSFHVPWNARRSINKRSEREANKQHENVFCSVPSDSSVGTVMGLDRRGIWVRFPVEEEHRLISTASTPGLGVYPAFYTMATGGKAAGVSGWALSSIPQ
jgi:hypothetical protein